MATQIRYDDRVLIDVDYGEMATLFCEGKQMLSDVEIVFGGPGSLTLYGRTIEVVVPEKITLHCAGKKMLSNIEVRANEDDGYQVLYTVRNRRYTTNEEQTFAVLESDKYVKV